MIAECGNSPCRGLELLPNPDQPRSLSPTHLASQLWLSCSTKASTRARLSAVEGGAPVGPCMSVRIYSPVPPTNKGVCPLEIVSCKRNQPVADSIEHLVRTPTKQNSNFGYIEFIVRYYKQRIHQNVFRKVWHAIFKPLESTLTEFMFSTKQLANYSRPQTFPALEKKNGRNGQVEGLGTRLLANHHLYTLPGSHLHRPSSQVAVVPSREGVTDGGDIQKVMGDAGSLPRRNLCRPNAQVLVDLRRRRVTRGNKYI